MGALPRNQHAIFEYANGDVFDRGADVSTFDATGRVTVDARTATDWGVLREYVRLDFSRSSGNAPLGTFGSGGAARGGRAIGYQLAPSPFPSFAGADTSGNRLQTGVSVMAFVQLGG